MNKKDLIWFFIFVALLGSALFWAIDHKNRIHRDYLQGQATRKIEQEKKLKLVNECFDRNMDFREGKYGLVYCVPLPDGSLILKKGR